MSFHWHSIGLTIPLLAALPKSYPSVRHPTHLQSLFIPAILHGHDVLLQDGPGSGKSFGVVLALLNMALSREKWRQTSSDEAPLSSLLITPHRDLAYQMLHWIQTLVDNLERPQDPNETAQIVVRDSSTSLESQMRLLREKPPHMLIGTPQALLDMHEKNADLLGTRPICSVALDEADYLLGVPSSSMRTKHQKAAAANFEKHPTPTRILLGDLLPARKLGARRGIRPKSADEEETGLTCTTHERSLQVIMSSATMHSNLRRFVTSETGWVGKGGDENEYKWVKGAGRGAAGNTLERVTHHALVVSPLGKVRDLREETDESESQIPEELEVSPSSSIPVDVNVLEAVATYFAVEVPRIALLVAPAMSSVGKITEELRGLGVDARALDMREKGGREYVTRGGRGMAAAERPVMLVTLVGATRGMDIAELRHVLILGVASVEDAEEYVHVAGRVGRDGGGGKVVTFLRSSGRTGRGGRRYNEPGLMREMYRRLGLETERVDTVMFNNIYK